MKKFMFLMCILMISIKSYAQNICYTQLDNNISIGVGNYDQDNMYFSIGSYSNTNANSVSFRIIDDHGFEKFNILSVPGVPRVKHVINDDGYLVDEFLYVINKTVFESIFRNIVLGDVLYINHYRYDPFDFIYLCHRLNRQYIFPHLNITVPAFYWKREYRLRPVYSPYYDMHRRRPIRDTYSPSRFIMRERKPAPNSFRQQPNVRSNVRQPEFRSLRPTIPNTQRQQRNSRR